MIRFIKSEMVFYISLLILGIGGFFLAVLWPQTEGFYGSIIAAAVAGIGVTVYIYYAKHYKKDLACPSGDQCNEVVTSSYSRFLGIPLEYLGMLYYSVIFLSYTLLIGVPALRETVLMPTVLILTAASFLFSVYLLFVQGFLLKRWCIWCLLSATLSTAIFVISLVSIEGAGVFLAGLAPFLEAIRSLGFVLGMGGATAAVFLFIRFLEDMDISRREANVLKGISEMIWLGLAFIFISEYAQYVAFSEQLAASGTFLIEIIALTIVFVSGAILKVLFAPFLDVLPFVENEKQKRKHGPLISLRKATLLTGSVALSSWYFAFFVNFLPEYSFKTLLSAYASLLIVIILLSLVWQESALVTNDS